jgi:hypothetical protein
LTASQRLDDGDHAAHSRFGIAWIALHHRHRERAQSLDGMQLPHSLPGLVIVSIVMRAAPFFSCAISSRAHIPTVRPMLSGGHDAAPFGAHMTLGNPLGSIL